MPSTPRISPEVRAEANRRRAEEATANAGPVVAPNFGLGPVGDTIVNGRVVTEQQRFANANQVYLDAKAALEARNAEEAATRKANIDRIVGIAKERANKFAIASSLRTEAQKFGPRNVGVLKVPSVAKPYEVQSRNGITSKRLLETADWVEQSYNESEFKADPSKRDAFMTELTQRVTDRKSVV